MKAKEIASLIEGEVLGDPEKDIKRPGYLFTAKKDELAYCFLKSDEKDLEAISATNAGIVICREQLRAKLDQVKRKPTLILSKAPKYDFAQILQEFFVEEMPTVSPSAVISSDARLGKNVDIHPNVVVYSGTIIGNRVVVRANAVLGAEGLDYGRNWKGELRRIPHLSQLIIEDDVDIGSNTTLQRGMLRPTTVGRGTKIGPNCDIGHEVRIGKHCIITGMTLVAGATEIGDYTYIAPHSTIRNSIRIGDHAFIGIGSLVMDDVPDDTTVTGRPAIRIEDFRKRRQQLNRLLGEGS